MKVTFNFNKTALLLWCLTAVLSVPACDSPSDGSGRDEEEQSYLESPVTLDLKLYLGPPAGETFGQSSPSAAVLTITAHDGATPVVTDLWIYTLDNKGKPSPLTDFTSNAPRKAPGLMLPARIGGKASGLVPADDGRSNGLMSASIRGTLNQGVFTSSVTGEVEVTLTSIPTSPILVVASVEDQRYGGAAVVNPDGTVGTVPAGAFVLEKHVRRSFARDVAPILKTQCTTCHNPEGLYDAELYLVTGSRDDLVNDNFALKEETEDCQSDNPTDPAALATCIQAITKAQFLVEPGAPALSDLLQRSRPDEEASTSPNGLAWYGGKGGRYNAKYGDRRMPSTTESEDPSDWNNARSYFDERPQEFQIIYEWVAQGAQP